MRTRTNGIQLAGDGGRIVNKQYKGQRIFERLGAVSQAQAEAWLRERMQGIDQVLNGSGRRGADRLWAEAAAKYLRECRTRKVRSIEMIARHIADLLPYLGELTMSEICNDNLESFILERQDEDEVKNSTINRTLEVVRTTVIRAARAWRDNGQPWLTTPPLIEMLDERAQKRMPYPITWAEQAKLLARLPSHLQETVEFAVNTGARDENVCGLRWEWERPVAELKRSVFVIPPEAFKGKRQFVLVLNDVAWKIVERRRGMQDHYVFTYAPPAARGQPAKEPRRIETQNNSAFQKARAAVGLSQVRVHDLRHTFGQRLRDAGVSDEDRRLLMGHTEEGMAQHYATSTLVRMQENANRVLKTRDRTTVLRVVRGQGEEKSRKSRATWR